MEPHYMLHGDLELTDSEQRRRDLKHALVDAARRLDEQILLLDAGAASEEEMQEVLAAVERAAECAGAIANHREGGLNRAPGWEAALTERSPISGRSNTVAAPLTLVFGRERTTGHAYYTRRHEGPIDHVHGGVIMGAFDELLGVAQAMSGQSGYTGTLSVKMRRPTPLHRGIDFEAGIDRVEGRKVFVWGRSLLDGEVLCEAEGVFISPRGRTTVEEADLHRR